MRTPSTSCLSAAILLTCMAACTQSQPSGEVAFTQEDADSALAYCHRQVLHAMHQEDEAASLGTTVGEDYVETLPRNIEGSDTAWSRRPVSAEEWCSGFWPGILWYDYAASGDHDVATSAQTCTMMLQSIIDAPVFDHDLGFLMYCSAGTGLKVLEHELQHRELTAMERSADSLSADYLRTLLLRTADSLATLYRPAVGTILSWPRNTAMFGGHNTIMDNMINLELLFWAARQGDGDTIVAGQPLRRKYYDIAVRHAETTMQHHFRPDFTSYHVVVYDSIDGHFIHGVTHQGLADSSMWARGQAWAIYGFTVVARETGEQRFLDHAQRVADVYLERLPSDYIPYWDFSDPRIPTSPEHPAPVSDTVAPRDASAAAVVASALIELSQLVADKATAYRYLDSARQMLRSLSSEYYQSRTTNTAFLLHSTGNLPAGSEIDASIIYADYYYIEALCRLRNLNK